MAAVDDLRGRLAPHLLPDERLLWVGRPDPGKHLTRSDLYLVPFSLLWGGFAIFWEASVVTDGAGVAPTLFGGPFVLVGLYLIIGRFFYKAHRKRRTVYGLTRDRALVAGGSGSLSEQPLPGTPLEQRRSRDGRHTTVRFGRSTTGWSASPDYANTGLELFSRGGTALGFYDVADVRALEAALREVRR